MLTPIDKLAESYPGAKDTLDRIARIHRLVDSFEIAPATRALVERLGEDDRKNAAYHRRGERFMMSEAAVCRRIMRRAKQEKNQGSDEKGGTGTGLVIKVEK